MTKHIAPFLSGLFVFPIFYQSVHVVCHHTSVQIEHCDSDYCTNNSFQKNSIKIIQSPAHCPVCEYQFSINNLPDISIFKAIMPYTQGVYNENTIQQSHNQICTLKPPRAPPSCLI